MPYVKKFFKNNFYWTKVICKKWSGQCEKKKHLKRRGINFLISQEQEISRVLTSSQFGTELLQARYSNMFCYPIENEIIWARLGTLGRCDSRLALGNIAWSEIVSFSKITWRTTEV